MIMKNSRKSIKWNALLQKHSNKWKKKKTFHFTHTHTHSLISVFYVRKTNLWPMIENKSLFSSIHSKLSLHFTQEKMKKKKFTFIVLTFQRRLVFGLNSLFRQYNFSVKKASSCVPEQRANNAYVNNVNEFFCFCYLLSSRRFFFLHLNVCQ